MDSQRHQLRGPPPQAARSQHHQASSPGQKPLSLTPAQQRILPLAKSTIFPITRLPSRYPPSLPANIQLCPDQLSFTTGRLSGHHEEFLLPLSTGKIDALLSIVRPAQGYAAIKDFDGPDHWLKNDNFTESYRLWSFVQYIMTSNEPEVLNNQKIIPSLTNWKIFNHDNRHTRARCQPALPDGEPGFNWQAEALLRYCVKGSRSRTPDPSKPHINCFLNDEAALEPGRIKNSELRTLLWIAAESASDSVYLNHTIFPATVVSWSGFSVRIVQAIVNFSSNKVSLRMSEVVSLKGGMQANPDEVKKVLGWLIGEPVGKTE